MLRSSWMLASLVFVLPIARAGEPVLLAWKVATGDRFDMVVELSADTNTSGMGVALGASQTARIEGVLVVGEVGGDKARVEFRPTRMVLHRVAGKTTVDRDLGPTDLEGGRMGGSLDLRGVLDLDWRDLDDTLEDSIRPFALAGQFAGLFLQMPKKPVAPRDTWTVAGDGVLERAELELAVYNIDSTTQLVEIRGTPRAKDTSIKVAGQSLKVAVDGEMTASFDAARGHLTGLDQKITVTSEGGAGGIVGKIVASVVRKVTIARK